MVSNEIVVAGNWPRWLICNGPGFCSMCTIDDSGTWPVVDAAEGSRIADSASSEVCNDGSASMMTRCWLDCEYMVEMMRWPNRSYSARCPRSPG